MVNITKEQIEEILRRMELNGASFIDLDIELKTNCFDYTWVESVSVDEYCSHGYIDTIYKFNVDDDC